MLHNQSSIFKSRGVGVTTRTPHLRTNRDDSSLAEEDLITKDLSLTDEGPRQLYEQQAAASNCDDNSYDQEEESSSDSGEDKPTFH